MITGKNERQFRTAKPIYSWQSSTKKRYRVHDFEHGTAYNFYSFLIYFNYMDYMKFLCGRIKMSCKTD